MKTMRTQRFIGCTGDVNFLESQNSRSRSWASMIQIIIDQNSKSFDLLDFGKFDKFSLVVYKMLNKPHWNTKDGSAQTNYRTSNKCVYDNNNKQASRSGLIILHLISLVFFLLSIITAFLSARKFKAPIEFITEKINAKYSDQFFMLFFLLEFFQILSLSLDKDILFNDSYKLIKLFGLNLIEAFNFEDENFWKFLNILLSLCGIYLTLVLTFITLKEIKKFKGYLVGITESILESLLPLLGHICFLAIFLSSIQVFRCENEEINNLNNSFFFRDCTQYCYKGKHLVYAIASGLVFSFFLVVSIYLRPYWERYQKTLSIKSNASYLSILSIFQLTLALVKTNSDVYSEKTSHLLICVVLILQAMLTVITQPYNYKRLKVLQILILSLCSWIYFISAISLWYSNKTSKFIILYLGAVLICIVGFKFLFKYPNVFISNNPKLIPYLFKFQFSNSFDHKIKLSKYFTVNTDAISIKEHN